MPSSKEERDSYTQRAIIAWVFSYEGNLPLCYYDRTRFEEELCIYYTQV